MKVIHILHELKFSGAEIMYVDAAPIFKKLGCELSVVATANKLGEFAPKFKEAGYSIYHKPYPEKKKYFKRIRFFIEFVRFIKQNKFQVIHNHSSKTFWGMAFCARIAGIRTIHTFHNVFPTNWYSRSYHILLRWSAKHLFKCHFQTISDSVYTNELNRFKNNTTLINNWYGSNRFYPGAQSEKNKIRKKLGISIDANVLISVGGCSPIKRHSEIIKALPIILKKLPNTIYLHLGEGISLDDEKNLARQMQLSHIIQFMGNQKDVRNFLVASDFYLMPSKHEGLPITTIEAMGSEVPTILYDVPGLKDFNKNGNNSYQIEENFEKLADAVIFLQKKHELRNKLVLNAKSYVDNKYDMKTNASKIYQLYLS